MGTKWDKLRITNELKNKHEILNKSPTLKNISPSLYQACIRYFGSFNNAKINVGLTIYPQKYHKLKQSTKKLSKEFAYVLGAVYGDGHYHIYKTGRRTNATIILQVKDKDFALEFKKNIEEWLGIKAKDYFKNNFYKVAIYSIEAVKIIKNIKISNIPKDFSKKLQSHFLRGLFDSDGGVVGTNLDKRRFAKRWIHFSNNDKEIINAVSSILTNFKISYKISSRVHSGFNSKKLQYEVLIYGKDNLSKFYKGVSFSIKRKQDSLLTIINSYGKH